MGFPILVRKRWHYAPAGCVDCGHDFGLKQQHCPVCKTFHEHEDQYGQSLDRQDRLLLLVTKALWMIRRARWRGKWKRVEVMSKRYCKWMSIASKEIFKDGDI